MNLLNLLWYLELPFVKLFFFYSTRYVTIDILCVSLDQDSVVLEEGVGFYSVHLFDVYMFWFCDEKGWFKRKWLPGHMINDNDVQIE